MFMFAAAGTASPPRASVGGCSCLAKEGNSKEYQYFFGFAVFPTALHMETRYSVNRRVFKNIQLRLVSVMETGHTHGQGALERVTVSCTNDLAYKRPRVVSLAEGPAPGRQVL